MSRLERDAARLAGVPGGDEAGTLNEPIRRKGWPPGLIGAIGLILVLDGLIARLPFPGDRGSRLAYSWEAACRSAAGPDTSAEILCFGDSLIKLGILPRVLEARLGRTAFNLAVLGGPPPTSHDLLRRVLERGRTPQALVVHFSPLLLGMDPRVNLEWWAGRIRAGERAGAVLRADDAGLAFSLILHGTLASLARRDEVREALGLVPIEMAGGEECAAAVERMALSRNWARNRGAQVAPRSFIPIEGALPQPYEGPGWSWKPSPLHAEFVDHFLSQAQERGIPVYWVIPPAEAGWLERNRRVGTIDAYRGFVRDRLARFPVLTVLDLQAVGWDRALFRDSIHLNRDGAIRLSLAVADAMAGSPEDLGVPGRWITMDGGGAVPPRSFQELLEDLDQSRLAVRGDEGDPITMEGPSR